MLSPLLNRCCNRLQSIGRRCLSNEAMGRFSCLNVTEDKPFVYHVQLNRPDKMNALNKTLWGEIGQVFEELGKDPDCRVVVLSGNGKVFCSGIDLTDLAALANIVQSDEDAARKAYALYPVITHYQNAFMQILKCTKPVLAAIHGPCVGGATNMITFTDVRYATSDAWFQVKETQLGLCADVGVLQLLPKLIGNQGLVRELCFTGRKFDSKEAEQHGLVSKVFDDKETMMTSIMSLAESIAKLSPVAVQGTKVHLNYAQDHTVQESLDYAARWNMLMLQSEDLLKAAMSMMTKSKEPPKFSKL